MKQACPCQSGKPYAQCCAPFHQGKAAPNAEALMRSRYSAYALKLPDYLNATWHPDTLGEPLTHESFAGIDWVGLTVHEAKLINEKQASVHFSAEFKDETGNTKLMTENSRFIRIDGRWRYVDGTHD